MRFEILPLYNRHANFSKRDKCDRKSNITAKNSDSVFFVDDEVDQTLLQSSSALARTYMIHPYCSRRAAYDMSSLALVVYDSIAIPLQMMNLPDSGFIRFMQWVTRLFWTIDMPMTCLTGYVTGNGDVEMRPEQVFTHYAKSWLPLDFLIVGVDWIELALSDPGSTLAVARLGKFGRAFRLIRMVRLLRLFRMREVFYFLCERIQNESMVVAINIFKIMGIIGFLAHLKGCFWATVGQFSDGDTWLVATGYELQSFTMQYAVSLHWSLSQFTGGMDEVTPAAANLPERIYAIAAWFFAFTLAATFLSGLTSSMTQLYILASADAKALNALRKYLHRMEISKGLAARVQRNAQHTLKEQNRSISAQNVDLLTQVSEPLRVELHYEMYGPMLAAHPFFRRYTDECPQVMRKVCHTCVKVTLVSAGDVIFNAGELSSKPQMYLVLSGTAQYVSERGKITTVEQGHWISEAVLWTLWMHRGNLTVTSDGRLCAVDALQFHAIASQFQHRDFSPKVYAGDFVKRLNEEVEPSDLQWFDELQPESVNPSLRLRVVNAA